MRDLPVCDRQKVKVYRNLKNCCLSVMQKQLVVGHAQEIRMSSVEFSVQEGGRQRCLNTKQKNVHAFVKGILEEAYSENTGADYGEEETLITYNPYKSNSFYVKSTGQAVKTAVSVRVTISGIYAIGAK